MSNFEQSVDEEIKMLRNFMLIHSFLYYKLAEPIVPDDFFDQQAKRLAELQKEHPEISKSVKFYQKEFEDWTGETGFHLPTDDYVTQQAYRVKELGQIFMAAVLE